MKVQNDKAIKLLEHQVAGVSYRCNVDDLRMIETGDPLFLEREPDNQHDRNAIKVLHDGSHIGYVPANFAQVFAPLMDHGFPFAANVVDCEARKAFVVMRIFAAKTPV